TPPPPPDAGRSRPRGSVAVISMSRIESRSQNEKVIMISAGQKVAVITGASQGIGAGLVAAYRKLGFAAVATSRNIAPSADQDVLTVQGDISDPATAERVIAAGVEHFGRIDTLVNNAGLFIAKPFTEYTLADYEAVTGVNLTGFFRITQLA